MVHNQTTDSSVNYRNELAKQLHWLRTSQLSSGKEVAKALLWTERNTKQYTKVRMEKIGEWTNASLTSHDKYFIEEMQEKYEKAPEQLEKLKKIKFFKDVIEIDNIQIPRNTAEFLLGMFNKETLSHNPTYMEKYLNHHNEIAPAGRYLFNKDKTVAASNIGQEWLKIFMTKDVVSQELEKHWFQLPSQKDMESILSSLPGNGWRENFENFLKLIKVFSVNGSYQNNWTPHFLNDWKILSAAYKEEHLWLSDEDKVLRCWSTNKDEPFYSYSDVKESIPPNELLQVIPIRKTT